MNISDNNVRIFVSTILLSYNDFVIEHQVTSNVTFYEPTKMRGLSRT